jgi:hypothetical protein
MLIFRTTGKATCFNQDGAAAKEEAEGGKSLAG